MRKAPCGAGSDRGGFSSSQAGKCPEGTDTDILNLFLIKDKALPYIRQLEKGGVLSLTADSKLVEGTWRHMGMF